MPGLHNTPPATDTIYKPGDHVLIWREKQVENRISDWLCPYVAVSVYIDDNITLARKSTDSSIVRFLVTQAKHFMAEDEATADYLQSLHVALQHFTTPTDPYLFA